MAFQNKETRTADREAEKQHFLAVIKDTLKEKKHLEQIKLAVGDDQKAFQFVMAAFSYVSLAKVDNKGFALWHCDPLSIQDAILTAANVGLRVDSTGLCYLIPYERTATLSIGYKGYVKKVKEANPTANFQTAIVFPDDEFLAVSKDGVASYEHVVAPANSFRSDYEKAAGVFCYLSYMIGNRSYADIERIGQREIAKICGKAKTPGVWNEWRGENMKKAVIKRATKLSFAQATASLDIIDNKHFDLDNDDMVDVTPGSEAKNGMEARMERARDEKRRNATVQGIVIDNEEPKTDEGRREVDNPPASEGVTDAVIVDGKDDQKENGKPESQEAQAGKEGKPEGGVRDDNGQNQKGTTENPAGDIPAVRSDQPESTTQESAEREGEPEEQTSSAPTLEETKRGFFKVEGKAKRFLAYADTEDAYNAFLSYLTEVPEQRLRDGILKANRRFMDWLSKSGQEAKVQKIYKTAEQGKL